MSTVCFIIESKYFGPTYSKGSRIRLKLIHSNKYKTIWLSLRNRIDDDAEAYLKDHKIHVKHVTGDNTSAYLVIDAKYVKEIFNLFT